MPKNRARIRATKALAASSDIRHPDASYLADNRKLVLFENGPVVYDFSEGPLRFHSLRRQMNEVQGDAERKGWRTVTIDPARPLPAVEELRREPSLIVVDIKTAYAPDTLDPTVVRLIEGAHPELNVVVGLHADDMLPAGLERGRNRRWVLSSDSRTLRLPDGTVHDFATGPLRYLDFSSRRQLDACAEVSAQATAKGWMVTDAILSGPVLPAAMADSQPQLINLRGGTQAIDTALNQLGEEIEAGLHSNLNVVIYRAPRHGENHKEPAAGQNIFPYVNGSGPHKPQLDNLAIAKTRIAFALRFADMLASGTDPATSLEAVARDMLSRCTPEAAAIGVAARSAITPIRSGSTLAHELKANHEELFGAHLVEVIRSSDLGGRLIGGLRDAAATLEADLRIGLIA